MQIQYKHPKCAIKGAAVFPSFTCSTFWSQRGGHNCISTFTLLLNMSTEYNPLPITQQPKPATMDATIKSEKAPRCCHGHVTFVSNSATDRPDNSCFRRLILPTALAAFVLLAGLSALSLSQGYLNLSDFELDDLLPRATSSTSSGSPFVKNKRE